MDEVLRGLWTALTGSPLPADRVRVIGSEAVLPGPFRVGAAAACSVAATTLAAGELLRAKGIDPGVATVDTREAAASFRSERHVLVDGAPVGDLWSPLSGDYRAADGWVKLHCNYPHHAAAACRALGVSAERDALEAAVAERAVWDVQEAVIGGGGAAAAMRTRAEWLGSDAGRAVSGLPLVDVVRMDEVAPVPLPSPSGDRPLSGVRVLELTHVIAGPVCGRVLTAYGADVLHIGAAHLPTVAPLVVDTGFGKRSAYLDLRSAAGLERLRELVRDADVIVRSFRPGSFERFGLDARALASLRPGIVVVDLCAYGWTGPWAQRRGFDSLVQLASGIAAECGAHTGVPEPRALPAQVLDHATGWLAAGAVMTALRRRAVEGGSWRVRLALARTGLWLDSLGRAAASAELSEVDDLLEVVASPFGAVTHVRMPGALPASPAHWAHGPRVPGSDPADWW